MTKELTCLQCYLDDNTCLDCQEKATPPTVQEEYRPSAAEEREAAAIWGAGSGMLGTTPVPPRHVTFTSGARRSEVKPAYNYMPGNSLSRTARRFEVGHAKYEKSEIFSEANWLTAVKHRDVPFLRQLFSHALEHLWAEMRGVDDPDAGGNLGAIGWFLEVAAYVQDTDPNLYAAARGLVELEN